MKKYLSVLLTVLLLTTAFGCLSALAETEQETVPDSYEELDETEHTVTATVWEYPIVDGEHASGKPVDESTYTEAHTFEDGECIYCGYVKEEDEEEDKEEDNITALTAVAEASAEGEAAKEAAAEETAEVIFTTASGIELSKGIPAAGALKKVLASIPANTDFFFAEVGDDIAAQLVELLNGANVNTAEMLAVLANFPVQTVDGVECYVVTLQYADAQGAPVSENYAFSTADATLVKVF